MPLHTRSQSLTKRRGTRSGSGSTIRSMPSEKELLERIRHLEEQNSLLQDKLDMIYAILAPDYEEDAASDESSRDNLVQIDGFSPRKKPE